MKRRALVYALLPGALFISAWLIGAAFGYRVNLTQSLPLGLWKRTDYTQASYVEFCLPEGKFAELVNERGYVPHGTCPQGLAPLLKPVAAREGDTVEVTPQGVSINGKPALTQPIAAFDSKGRPLPAVAPGTYKVPAQTLWVISTYHPRSLDSRYFGPLPASSVLSGMTPVLVFNQREDYALVHR